MSLFSLELIVCEQKLTKRRQAAALQSLAFRDGGSSDVNERVTKGRRAARVPKAG